MHEALFVVVFFLLGLSFGSFATVLIDRLPHGERLLGRSRCLHCKKQLLWLHLAPLLSYLCLRGKCAYCSAAIPMRYALLEIGSGMLFILALYVTGGDPAMGLVLALALWLLSVAAMVDADTQMIPDHLSIPFVVLSLLLALLNGTFDPLAPLVGLTVFGGQWLLSGRRWMGSGDIILAVGMGFLLGPWQMMVFAIGASYVLGAVWAMALLLTREKTRHDHIAFGPFLAAGTILTLLVGPRVDDTSTCVEEAEEANESKEAKDSLASFRSLASSVYKKGSRPER